MSKHKDMKESLTTARKADITHVRGAFLTYTARPCEYGSDKYERANFRRPTGDAPHIVPTRADFERFRAYLRAAVSHVFETLDSMELHLANDPQLLDVEGMKVAAYAVDSDVTPGSKVGPSMLPHVAAACASLNMAITQATDCGLLPRDPGTPWRKALPEAGAKSDLDAVLKNLPEPDVVDMSKVNFATMRKEGRPKGDVRQWIKPTEIPVVKVDVKAFTRDALVRLEKAGIARSATIVTQRAEADVQYSADIVFDDTTGAILKDRYGVFGVPVEFGLPDDEEHDMYAAALKRFEEVK